MLKRSVLKTARKKLLLSFQYDFNNPYQLPKPKRHSYSLEDKGFIVIGFNLSLTTWKDKSKLKCNILVSLVSTALLFEFIFHACCSVSQILQRWPKICPNCSIFLVSFACNNSQPWSDPGFWELETVDKDLTTRIFSTFTSMFFFFSLWPSNPILSIAAGH